MNILYINLDDSRCGRCNGNADPSEVQHLTIWTWTGTLPGCGVTFTHTSTDYWPLPELVSAIIQMRPDLPFITAQRNLIQ